VTLRAVILAICGLIVLSAFAEYAFGHVSGLLIGLQAVVVLALIAFERRRYRPVVKDAAAQWLPTGEKFEDPSSGKTVEVYENPHTGERDYRPA
jgi:hypothetical protein